MSNQPNDDGRDGLPSASGVERLVNCPGSKSAELACGPMPDSDIADQGSRIHLARETGDVSGLDDEEIQIVQGLEAIEVQAVAKWREDLGIPADVAIKCVKEERIWVREIGSLKPLASAKVDRYWTWGRYALIVDDKTGFLPTTPSPKNWQLRTAALALWSELSGVENIRVAIAQHRFRSRYDACDYAVEDLISAATDLFNSLWKAEQPDAERIPGHWCKYCRAKANCPQAAALSLLPMVKTGVTYPDGLRGHGLKSEISARVSLLGPQDLAFIYRQRHIMAGIQESVQIRLKQMLAGELAEIGLMLEPNSPTREVADLDGAFNILIRDGLMSVDEFHTCCKLTLGKVEELVKKRIVEKGKAKNQDEAKRYLGTLLSPVIKLNTKNPSLVPLETLPEMPAVQPEMPVIITNQHEQNPINNTVQPIKAPKKGKAKRASGAKAGAVPSADSGEASV